MTKDPQKDCCHTEIRITNHGNVNIYACSSPAGDRPPHSENECTPVSPGQCVPLALGVKPKQSQRHKLDRLLAKNRVPSAFGAAFVHMSRRFVSGRQPSTPLEESVFDRLRALPPNLKSVLRCALDQFDALPPAERSQLFDMQSFGDVDTPIDVTRLADAFGAEIAQRASELAFDDPDCLTERPGKIRVFDPGQGEFLESQVHICRVNGLRTLQFTPPLDLSEYVTDELQQECVPVVVNGQLEVNCTVQKHNCPGHASVVDGTCFRVLEVEAGGSVTLEGVNFFSVDTTVRLSPKGSGETGRVVDTHVCGDLDTPVTEEINGETRLIADCRVHDRLTFRVPDDLPAGIYEVYVDVPNITGIANLGTVLTAPAEFISVIPSSTARFEIISETLFAHRETSPAFFGSDEIAVRFLTAGLFADGTWSKLQHVDSLHGNVDSGDVRDMTCVVLPAQDQPLAAVAISIFGHEVDNYPTYLAQVQGFTDAYLDILKRVWKPEVLGVALFAALAIPGGGWAVLVVAAVAAGLMLAANLFIALWAPADLIIQDVVFLSAGDLAALTSDAFAAPSPAQYITSSEIKVKVDSVTKGGGEYLESRDYTCDDEDSRYEIRLRYRRTA
jgi:hypothetical protein